MTVIYGAGIAGLLAGCHFQTAKIFEAGSPDQCNRKAFMFDDLLQDIAKIKRLMSAGTYERAKSI